MRKVAVLSGILILLLSAFGPFFLAASEEVGPEMELDELSEIDVGFGSYFSPNMGQIMDETVLFYTENAYFTSDGAALRVMGDDTTHIIKIRFDGANGALPVGMKRASHVTNYFLGDDPSSWVTGVPSYEELYYEGLYDNIDLVYRAGPNGLKYDLVVRPGGDVSDIRMAYSGADPSIHGNDIMLRTPIGAITDGGLYAYQAPDGEEVQVRADFVLKDGVVGFDVDYDRDQTLVIDPLIFSTFIGGNQIDRASDIAMDSKGNLYIIGQTASQNFPTTDEAYDTTFAGGGNDVIVSMLKNDGSGLIYSTYIGGTGDDIGNSIAIDDDNNTYITGYTSSNNFPTTNGVYDTSFNGAWDVFVVKLNSSGGSLDYSTFVGGTSLETGYGIAIDDDGHAYIVGETFGFDFPSTPGSYDPSFNGGREPFIFKLEDDGSAFVFSTFYGGSACDAGNAIALDQWNNMYVTGMTHSNNFPTTAGAFDRTFNPTFQWDGYVLRLNFSGASLDYSTYFGGGAEEYGYGIFVDSDEVVYVTGDTHSADFPTTVGANDTTYGGGTWTGGDAFALKLKADFSDLVYSTYLGDTEPDVGRDIIVDQGAAYIIGFTGSDNYTVTEEAYQTDYGGGTSDAFLTVVAANGSALDYSTFFGGGGADEGRGLVLSTNFDIFMAGFTSSIDFPTTDGAYDTSTNGGDDVFVADLVIPPLPGAPGGLTAVAGDSYVDLQWDIPEANFEDIVNYKVLRGPTGDEMTELVEIGTVTNYNDTAVANGQTYFYRVAAVNNIGNGPVSDFVSVTPGAVPGMPTALMGVGGDETVDLAWTAPGDNGGFDVQDYSVVRDDGTDEVVVDNLGNVTEYSDTDVVNGVTYEYKVRALNSLGWGPLSDGITVTPGSVPSTPLTLTATDGDRYVQLGWDAPADIGGFEVTSYKVYRGPTPQEMVLLADVSDIQHNDTTVDNGGTYHYAVSAINILGEGVMSPSIEVRPGIPPASITGTAEVGNGYVDLAWEEPANGGFDIELYNIYKGETEDGLELFANTTALTYYDPAVVNGVTYFYAVTGINLKGEGQMGAIIQARPATLPGAPEELALEAGDGFVTLTWAPPTETGGLPIVSYSILRGEDDSDMIPLTGTTYTAYTDANVTNGVTYYYSVAAVTELGEGPLSGNEKATPLGPPAKVTDLKAVAGNGIVDLTWKEPADGGTKITTFKVYRKEGDGKMQLLQTVSRDYYNDKSVENGKTYTYQVSAVNKVGEGPLSNAAEAAPGSTPEAPVNVEVVYEDGQVVLTWDPPVRDGGFDISEYKVYRGTSSSDMTDVGAMGTGTTYTDSDLEDGAVYYYKVSAVNVLGEGDASAVVFVKVPEKKVENNSPLGAMNYLWILIVVIVAVVCAVAVAGYMRHRSSKPPETPPPQQPAPEPPAQPPVQETPPQYQEQSYQQPEQVQQQYYQPEQQYQQQDYNNDQYAGQWDQSQGWDQGYDPNPQYYEQQPPQQY